MAAGGRCIARVEGKAVFVSGLLPGEVAEVNVTARHKGYDEAHLVNLLESSPYRVEPACPLASKCGGCSLMIATHEGQRKFKMEILKEQLERFRSSYDGIIEEIISKPFEYRSRFQFHKNAKGEAGFCRKGSSYVIAVADCPVAVREARLVLKDGSLKKRASRVAKERFAVFSYGGKTLIEGEGDDTFMFSFCGKEISFDIRSFFQSNVAAFEEAVREAVRFAADGPSGKGSSAFLDLYSGCGVFSLLASDYYDELCLVEESPASCASAKANLKGRGDARVFEGKDSDWVKTMDAKREFAACVVDPPRGGIGRGALEWLLNAKIGRLAYLSCSAPTFARDAARLATGGWRLRRVILCDFYPQTPHIETLGLFDKEQE